MPRPALALVLLAGILAAGCASPEDKLPLTRLSDAAPRFDGAYSFPAPVAHDAHGAPADLGAWAADDVPVYVEQMVPGGGAEPNVGVTSKGSLFVTSGEVVMRSRDHGRTWEEVFDFVPVAYPRTVDQFDSADPMLWVDPDTDRVFVNHMHPALLCTYLAWSDDDGETFTHRPMACGVPVLDHQKLMTARPGPALPAVTTPAYPNLAYLCVNKIQLGTTCAVSYDGGLSFAYERQAYVNDQLCGNINGHPAAFPDGTVAMVLGNLGTKCERPLTVAVTEDNGLTWDLRQCAPEADQVEIDADVTVTPDGTAYVLYRDADQMAHLLRSTDKFRTCETFRVAPPDHTLSVFAGITSGDDGRVAMAYLGTRDPQEPGATPSNATPGTVWHLYVTTSLDAASPVPTFLTQQVTPEQDPVQVGCVWLGGGAGGPFACRNLLDFIDVVRDHEGRVYVAITDGCSPRNGCTGTPVQSDFQSRDREIAVAVLDRGASLFAQKGRVAPLGLEHPKPLPEEGYEG